MVGSSIKMEIVKFLVVQRDEVVGREEIRRILGGFVVAVVFKVVNGVVGTPLHDKTALLNEWLIVGKSKGLDPGNGSVRHRKGSPVVTGKGETRGKGEEMVIPVGVAGGVQGNGPKRSCTWGVAGGIVFENLDVGAKFQT